ncbi:PDR/VanB family oxidoreductase [Novosphingobium nitrogenifigens]|nr:PDR/VanB family oxidoreductase [Novosphingobium nitrogenifigens]
MMDTSLLLRVARTELLSPTLKRIVLEAADGGLLPPAAAGAHITLTLPVDPDGKPVRNSYSLVSASGQAYELIVRRAVRSRGGSHYVHDRLGEGAVLEATIPHNLFPLSNVARKHLLIGGGIGITPMLSFLSALRASDARVELHQVAASDEAGVFTALLGPRPGDEIHVHAGRGGLDLAELLAVQPLGTHVYTCGPAALMDAVVAQAKALGWPASHVHREDFGAAGGEPFVVRLAKSGQDVAVDAEETMLEALERVGAPVRSLCRGGACGECVVSVVEGVPEHRDHYLSDAEKASGLLVMPCMSRACSDVLVLDL